MIQAPELTIANLNDYMDEDGRVHIPVTVDQAFLLSWQAADEAEWESHDSSYMMDVVEDMLEAIFVEGDFPETQYEMLEPSGDDTGYDVECDFSFEL